MRPNLRNLLCGGLATLAAATGLAPSVRAADFELDNLRFGTGGLSVVAPRVEVKGAVLEREAFRAALDGSSGEAAAIRMGKLDAREIVVPELIIEQTVGPQKQVTTYRALRLQSIAQGKVGMVEAASGTLAATGAPTGSVAGTFQATRIEALDLKQAARVLTESAAPGASEPMLPLFGRLEQDGYALDMGAAGKVSLGKTISRGFSARVGDQPLHTLFTRIMELAAAQEKAGSAKPDPAQAAEGRRLALAMLSLYQSISYGSGESRDLSVSVTAPAQAGAGPEPVEFKIARIAYGEEAPDKSGFAIVGLAFAGGGARGTIGLISHSGFSFDNTLAELKALLSRPDADLDLDAIDYRRFIPTLGTLRMAGFAVTAPQKGRPGRPAPPPVSIGLDSFELRTAEQFNGVPTSVAFSFDGLKAPVVEGPNNPAAKDLLAMGYRTLNLSAKLDLGWDQAKSELAIRSLSLGGAGMARFEAKGTLGNITKDLFASDVALAQVAALGATVRSLDATLQNQGLIEKLIENEARKAGRKPEDLRREYAMIASLGLSAMLGPSDAAKTLTGAVARFVARPGTLTVQARPKAAAGLGLADVIALGDPTEILEKIDLQAHAE
jgi:hypothetical protein